MTRWLVEMQAREHLLALRELLVRHDENIKADTLMRECVPYFLEGGEHPDVYWARSSQAQMVAHLASDEAYRAYYAANQHERPFEEMYGIVPEQANAIPRVSFLRESLRAEHGEHGYLTLLDLSCNDGWLGVNLCSRPWGGPAVAYTGIDLNPDCIKRANDRGVAASVGFIEDAPEIVDRDTFDAVVCFEAVEHVRDPDRVVSVAKGLTTRGGLIFLSTPNGAVEQGNVPRWFFLEPKGHVRVYTPATFRALCEQAGELEELLTGPDGVMVARIRRT